MGSRHDTTNVDEEFLDEAAQETFVEDSPILQEHNASEIFDNFSFVNTNTMIDSAKQSEITASELKKSFEEPPTTTTQE